mgnify:FL=1
MVYKTITARTTTDSIVKPAELIDVVELTPLKLIDRRIFNLLLASAWDDIAADKEHSVRKSDLLVNTKATERLDASIGRLMGSRVRINVQRDGQDHVLSFPFLEHISEPVRKDGNVYYKFPAKLRELVQDSTVFARLQKSVMFQLSSKYALCCYELIQRRGNLDYQWSETFTLEQLRSRLGVEKGKLKTYKNFKARALLPAVQEVDFLSDFHVSFCATGPTHKKGNTIVAVTLSWHKKSLSELKEVFQEMRISKSGRKARMNRTVEVIVNQKSS